MTYGIRRVIRHEEAGGPWFPEYVALIVRDMDRLILAEGGDPSGACTFARVVNDSWGYP